MILARPAFRILSNMILTLLLLLSSSVAVAQPALPYEVDAAWPDLPAGANFGPAASVDTDANGNVYIFTRLDTPILVFDKAGNYARSFGANLFTNPHGIRIDSDGNIWGVDDGSHVAVKMNPAGRVMMVLGRHGFAAIADDRFDGPTDIGFGPDGELYVADGNNHRVVKFSKQGRFVKAWGEKGSAESQFNLPHGIAVDKQGRVYVCDRENKRVQIFDGDGKHLDQWTNVGSAFGIDIAADQSVYIGDARGSQFLKFSPAGKLLGAHGKNGEMPGELGLGPHHLAVTPDGTVFTTEIPNLRVQKFAPR